MPPVVSKHLNKNYAYKWTKEQWDFLTDDIWHRLVPRKKVLSTKSYPANTYTLPMDAVTKIFHKCKAVLVLLPWVLLLWGVAPDGRPGLPIPQGHAQRARQSAAGPLPYFGTLA